MTAGEQLQKLRRKAPFALSRWDWEMRHCWAWNDTPGKVALLKEEISFLQKKLEIAERHYAEQTKAWRWRNPHKEQFFKDISNGEVPVTDTRGGILSAAPLPGEVP